MRVADGAARDLQVRSGVAFVRVGRRCSGAALVTSSQSMEFVGVGGGAGVVTCGESGDFASCHVMSRHVTSRHVTSRHVMSCHVMSCHVMSCPLCRVVSCRVMSCCVASCHVVSLRVLSLVFWGTVDRTSIVTSRTLAPSAKVAFWARLSA